MTLMTMTMTMMEMMHKLAVGILRQAAGKSKSFECHDIISIGCT